MSEEKTKESASDLIENECPILYKLAHSSRYSTRSCYYGFEFGHGWDNIVSEMSYKLEAVNNMFHPKTRVRIQIDQLKSKFGLPCFYWSIVTDNSAFPCFISNILNRLITRLENLKFNYVKVIDSEAKKYDKTEEITREEYMRSLSFKANNEDLAIKDGKFFKTLHLIKYGTHHMKPTKNLIAYWMLQKLKALNSCSFLCNVRDTPETRAAQYLMQDIADAIVKKTDLECQSTCEECGNRIGTDWSPSCQLHGWVTYVCKECAEKSNRRYYLDGALYQNGKILKSAQEIENENKIIQENHNKEMKRKKEYLKEQMSQADMQIRSQMQISLNSKGDDNE